MRIAIVDDNIADRRHAERLLKRESDRVHAAGAESYVIDCFGNTEKLYPMADTYDVLFIDMADSPENGLEIARNLRSRGVVSAVVLCSSKIDYRAAAAEDEGFLHLQKPFEPEPLIEKVRECELNPVVRRERIELRAEGETVYTDGDDIICAVETEASGRYLMVHLTGREPVRIMSDAPSFFGLVKNAAEMIPVSDRAFVNTAHIKKIGLMSVEMKDGTKLHVSVPFRKNLRDL